MLARSASGLSATRPPSVTAPASAPPGPDGASPIPTPTASTSAASPSSISASNAAPASAATVQDSLAVLLTTLSAQDGESILSIAVEESTDARDDHRWHALSTGAGAGTRGAQRQAGRVYGGSQGGSIHVSTTKSGHPAAPLLMGSLRAGLGPRHALAPITLDWP